MLQEAAKIGAERANAMLKKVLLEKSVGARTLVGARDGNGIVT